MRKSRVLICIIITRVAGLVSSFGVFVPNINREKSSSLFSTNVESHDTVKAAASWMNRLQELRDYEARIGDTLVPKLYPDNQPLGNWVNKQRQRKKNGTLKEDQIRALDNIGFIWNTSEMKTAFTDRWWIRFEGLKSHVRQGGYASIKSGSRYWYWIGYQRKQYALYSQGQNSVLSKDMVDALDSIDFPWKSKREQIWDSRIRELQSFKEKYGHCMVPISYEANRQLANWVSSQRKYNNLRESGKPVVLSNKRKEQLQSLDFVWNPLDHRFQEKQT